MIEFKEWLIHDSEEFQLVLYFVFLATLLFIESVLHYRKIRKGKRWITNFLLTILAIVSMSIMPITFISSAFFAEQNDWGLFNLFEFNWILLGLLTLLLRGFISFLTHFLAHKIPLFWRVHRVHHIDTEMDVTTTVRFHPFEFAINSIIGIPIVLVFGFPVWGLMLYELFDIVITLLSHSNISFNRNVERIVRYVFVTPDLHRIHHSSYQPETDSNFSAVFPIWDILFGTFKTKTRTEPKEMELGLEEVQDNRADKVGWLLKSPFLKDIKNE